MEWYVTIMLSSILIAFINGLINLKMKIMILF